ncbi:MAG TPA: hypothetical protein PKM82_13355, partial [Acidovorax sp.]|nr:hypothetical protein [Acidovorax sp.]
PAAYPRPMCSTLWISPRRSRATRARIGWAGDAWFLGKAEARGIATLCSRKATAPIYYQINSNKTTIYMVDRPI